MRCAHAETAALPTEGTAAQALLWRCLALAERVAAGFLLLLLAPLILFSAMLVVLLSGQAPLVAHRRVGQFGRPLWVIKLRTMWTGRKSVPLRWLERLPVSTTSMYLHKKSDDARVSSGFARFCRRFSIDEIPQLLQVVKGEMTLIGPRPLTGGEIEQYYGLDALELLSVKPGLTGLWQVSGRSRLTYGQRRRLDLFFIRKRSVTLYLRVALATVPVWLTGRDAW